MSLSTHGQTATRVNRAPGISTPGMNADGIVIPRIVGSIGGKIRSAPSSQPTYQSGCDGDETSDGSNGPYAQIGLICTSPPIAATTAAVRKNRPPETNAWPGQKCRPTTFVSRSTGPRNWVCFWRNTRPTWLAMPPANRAGSSITWRTKNREMKAVVGNSPPKTRNDRYGPMNGTDIAAE